MPFINEGRGRSWPADRAQRDMQEGEVTSKQEDADDAVGDGGRVSVLERAFQVLEQVAGGARPLNLTEVSRAAHLPLPTTYRLAKTLVELGALEKAAGRYTLGPLWVEWAEAAGQARARTSR